MTLTNNASTWRVATVAAIVEETPTVKTYTFMMPEPVHHLAGQHYEIRLTSEDGYQAARLYSAASIATGDTMLQLTVGLLPYGEVSPYLYESLHVSDNIEIRGPLGKFFVWKPTDIQPVLLIGGGSGVVPMRCILQAHAQANSSQPIHLLYSERSYDDIIYKDELLDNPNVTITLTSSQPDDWQGASGRIMPRLIQSTLNALSPDEIGSAYICGVNAFVEAVAQQLVSLNIPPARIRVERFGA